MATTLVELNDRIEYNMYYNYSLTLNEYILVYNNSHAPDQIEIAAQRMLLWFNENLARLT